MQQNEYARRAAVLERAFQRGDIDDKTFDELMDQLIREANRDEHR